MESYVVNPLYSGKTLIETEVLCDPKISSGLKTSFEAVKSVTWVGESNNLSDAVFIIQISNRADREDIDVALAEIRQICAKASEE